MSPRKSQPEKVEEDADRDLATVARLLLDMKPLNWVTLIATVSVTEIVALARSWREREPVVLQAAIVPSTACTCACCACCCAIHSKKGATSP
jgi:hypothetical protein